MTNGNRKSNIRPLIRTTEKYRTTFINNAQFQEVTPIQMQPDIRKEKQQ